MFEHKYNQKGKKVYIKIKATNLGLITNIFHYIDLYSHLLGSKFKAISFNQKSKFETSKRKGFLDIYNGECRATFENDSCLNMNCFKTKSWKPTESSMPPEELIYHYIIPVSNHNKRLLTNLLLFYKVYSKVQIKS